jgi:2-polyprenyl-3-methyl-5-hydroxy-6-metoxy-1,4-benzoquinol methylase
LYPLVEAWYNHHNGIKRMDHNELTSRIDPWLQHMRWRKDFAQWREKRLNQEFYQQEPLGLLQQSVQLAHLAERLTPAHMRVADHVRYHLALPPWEREMIARSHTLDLLDLGCGMGGFAVAAALAGITVTAVDYHADYCAITTLRAARYNLAIPTAVAAGEVLPLPSARFDAVTCWDVLEHVQSPARLLAEVARVLRPGGVVVLTAINRYAFRDPHYHLPLINWLPRPLAALLIAGLGRAKRGRFCDRQDLRTMHYFTWGQLNHLVKAHGFRLYDLDALRVARGEVGTHHRWRRLITHSRSNGTGDTGSPSPSSGAVLLLYYVYRAIWQGTWRVALVKQ